MLFRSSTYVKKAGDTISGDLVVQGNVTISGVTTYANTQTLLIGDNIITLNNDLPAAVAPSEDAGIEIKRGTLSNVSILWNESSDKWTFTNDGTNYKLIASNTDVESANNYAGAMANAKVDTITSNSTSRIWANSVTVSGIETVYLDLSTSGVTATTYGGATQIPVLAVDAYGRITSASNVSVQGMDYAYANTIWNVANSGFNKANSANVLAKAAYDYANTLSGGATISATAPSSPTAGALWWNTTYGRLMVYYNDGNSSQWVDATATATHARVDTSNITPSGANDGQLWWNSEYGRLFVYYNDGDTSQ